MKLSDAVVLASGQIRLNPHTWYTKSPYSKDDDCGCLIGMGCFSTDRNVSDRDVGVFAYAMNQWPWLGNMYKPPCDLGFEKSILPAHHIISMLAHNVYMKRITFEQAVEWIRQNEPQEEEMNAGNRCGEATQNEERTTNSDNRNDPSPSTGGSNEESLEFVTGD